MQAGNPPHHQETQRDGTDSNLVILRASRLEALVPPLMAQLRQLQPDKLLAAQTVVAAHPGMKQWLAGAMARQAGPGGIVANIDVLLPSSWLDRLARERLGDQAVALPAWQRRQLRWSVHAALQSGAVPGLADPRISRYLGADQADSMAERERRRFQLADRLAAVYSQYLVYRPDWLAAWEAGQWHFATARHADPALAALEQSLLAPLWKHLSHQLGPHRARVTEQLVQQLQQPDPQREPVHVFGLSHLPPAEMQVLRAWACHAPVFLYLPDPCREYWGGLRPPGAHLSLREQLARLPQWQQQEAKRIEQAEGGDWLDETQNRDHPLLARWGRLGQHFYAQLADADALADIRHGEDEAPATANNQLQRLQHSIRQLDHALLHDAEPCPARTAGGDADAASIDAWWQARRRDPSLRIHACHTRLRELEVLRDALLDALAAGIEPGRMVVMAPDIGAYAALLPAVFGSPGDPRERRLPWHLADAPLMRSHRLFSTVTRLLEAGSQRFTATEIADLLGAPEIARALGLDPAAHTALLGWLGDSRAAWALDAAHRQRFGVPPAQMHTLAWGVDRMLAGYVMGDAGNPGTDAPVQLPDGSTLLPLSGVHGPASSGVGALDVLLCELQRWQALAETEQTASAWVDTLTRRLETLLRIDPQDADAAAAWSAIRALLARIGQEPAQAGQDPLLHFAVVRDLLLDALGSVPERQRFLMGGITFCGMVPQRAIPFDMVCVLGLDDGEFPRQSRDGGIDLMARLRRLGDRDVRTDDRWLFLETLMSARQRLHLSWLGQSARDGKPRNPAAPLAELMSELEQATGSQGLDDEQARPWLLQHPLQAFDARYFDGSDPALFSYSQAFARMQGEGNAQLPSFLQAGVGTPAQTPDPAPERLPLRALTRFWKAPAEDLLGKRLQLDLAALQDDTLDASEPLEARLSKRDTVARRVFFRHALPAGRDAAGTPRWSPQPIPAWVEHAGLLPPGELGRQAWRSEAEAVLHLLQAATEHEVPLQETDNLAVDIALPAPDDSGHAVHLQGSVAQLLPLADGSGWQLLRAFPDKGELKAAGNLHLGERLVMFIEWAALRLHTGDMAPAPALHLTVLAKGELELARQIRAWDAAFLAEPLLRATRLHVLRERLATLLRLWWQAAIQPPLYFPHTSNAVLDADSVDAAAKQAAAAFESGFNRTGEREHAPGWTRLLARGIGFDPRQDAAAGEHLEQLLAYARQLEALMQLTEVPPTETDPEQAA